MRTLLVWVQVKQFPVAVPFQEFVEFLHEAFAGVGISLGDVLKVGAHEDQTAGAVGQG